MLYNKLYYARTKYRVFKIDYTQFALLDLVFTSL